MVARPRCFLTKAAIVERMRHEFRIPVDGHLVYGGAIYEPQGREALADINRGHPSLTRLIGLQANTSRLSPEELNNHGVIRSDGADSLVESVMALRRDHAFRGFGGCCGPDHTHLEKLAARLAPYGAPIFNCNESVERRKGCTRQ